jgi:hypothetical protein
MQAVADLTPADLEHGTQSSDESATNSDSEDNQEILKSNSDLSS